MNDIQFSILSYYPSIANDENINVGMLFYRPETNEKRFYVTTNFKRLGSFDDELDVDFMKSYLEGVKIDWENSENKTIEDFTYNFCNELRFGRKQYSYADKGFDEFIGTALKMYFRYDFVKSERPSEKDVRKYVRSLLHSNSISFSTKSIDGGFNERVNYDFVIDEFGFKSFFADDSTNFNRHYMNLKGWAYTARKNKENRGVKTVFIVDCERNDDAFRRAKSILSSEAYVISSGEVIPFIQKQKMA